MPCPTCVDRPSIMEPCPHCSVRPKLERQLTLYKWEDAEQYLDENKRIRSITINITGKHRYTVIRTKDGFARIHTEHEMSR